MASRSAPELPQFKGRPGWEFTDISGLDLAGYAPAGLDEKAAAVAPLFDLSTPAELPPPGEQEEEPAQSPPRAQAGSNRSYRRSAVPRRAFEPARSRRKAPYHRR